MSQSAQVVGARFAYRHWGEGFPTILLHRPDCSVATSHSVRSALGENLSLYLVVPEDSADSDWFVRFLDALGLNRVHLIGCPGTGAVALDWAERHPRRCSRIVLVDASISASVFLTERIPVMIAATSNLAEETLNFLGRLPSLSFEW